METKYVITIARQFGSGGREIGQKLAQKFSIPFYDRKAVAEIARNSGAGVVAYEDAQEKTQGDELYSLLTTDYSFDCGSPVCSGKQVSGNVFLLQKQILLEAARKGPCVIVGRCADEVLRGTTDLFSVFVCADKLSRMDRIVQKYGIPAQNAAEQMIIRDKQRSNYYSYCSNKKWGAPDNYFLSVNSSAFGVDAAVGLIAETVCAWEEQNREKVS